MLFSKKGGRGGGGRPSPQTPTFLAEPSPLVADSGTRVG